MTDQSNRNFAGALLTAAGVLIATLSGLCSLSILGPNVRAVLQGSAPSSSLTFTFVLVGLFGGLPFGAGVTMIVAGVRRLRRPLRDNS